MNIFLSYRRTDTVHALWLYPWLIQLFGRERVFWDRKDIEPGENFTEVLEKQIQSSNAFISLVSNDWLHAKDDKGSRGSIHLTIGSAARPQLLFVKGFG